MPAYIGYMEFASYALGVVGLLCWFIVRMELRPQTLARLLGYAAGGLCLLSYALTLALPEILSPTETITGPVAGFHAVSVGRGGSYFEFNVRDQRLGNRVLHSHYFDKGFYFGDPLIYDGATVRAAYRTWTGQVVAITELTGTHAGWSFVDNSPSVAPWIIAFAGVILMVRGAVDTISDRLATPQEQEDANTNHSDSTLGL